MTSSATNLPRPPCCRVDENVPNWIMTDKKEKDVLVLPGRPSCLYIFIKILRKKRKHVRHTLELVAKRLVWWFDGGGKARKKRVSSGWRPPNPAAVDGKGGPDRGGRIRVLERSLAFGMKMTSRSANERSEIRVRGLQRAAPGRSFATAPLFLRTVASNRLIGVAVVRLGRRRHVDRSDRLSTSVYVITNWLSTNR